MRAMKPGTTTVNNEMLPQGKARPTLKIRNGAQFPREARCGKCVPESAFKTGHTFRNMVLREAASRSEPEFWDRLPLQTEEGALPAVDAGSAPFALSNVEARSRGLRPLGAGGSVDGEHRARDVGGHVARQEDKGVGDILGLAHAAERNGGDDGLDDLFG